MVVGPLVKQIARLVLRTPKRLLNQKRNTIGIKINSKMNGMIGIRIFKIKLV